MRRWYVWLPISLALLGLVVWRTRPWDAVALAAQLDWTLLLATVALNLVVVLAWAVRSRDLMAAVGSPLGVRPLIPIVSFANTVNNLTPASSGEVLRAMILKRRHGVPYPNATAVILVERLWAIGIMFTTALAAAVGTLTEAPPLVVAAAWIGAIVVAFAPALLYIAGLRPGPIAARYAAGGDGSLGRIRRLAGHLASVDDRLTDVLIRPRRSIHFVLTTAIVFATFAIQLWLVLMALGVRIDPVAVWAAYGLAICAGVISALPFGLGATDLVLVILLGSLGVEAATAGAATLLLRLVTTLPLGILGTVSWVVLNRGEDGVPSVADAEAAAMAEDVAG